MHIDKKEHALFKTCCRHITKRVNNKKNIITIVMYRAAIEAKNSVNSVHYILTGMPKGST